MKKPNIKIDEIKRFYCFSNLSDKTQMIRNIKGSKEFLNRMNHTNLVADIAVSIADRKNLFIKGVDKERLICSALLHDIGHTPFGHAGEDAINDLFLSKDEIYYSKHNAGLFKHNLNSIRLIGKHFYIDHSRDYVLIDSILKHGSTFPKQYDYQLFKEDNILKQNFVFNSVSLSKSPFLKNFVNHFISKANFCKSMSALCVPNCEACHFCKSRKNNLCYIHPDSALYALTMYLAYPYPLTCEGTVLFWADEIACLCGDIFDTLKFVRLYVIKHTKSSILFSNFKSQINLLMAKYGSNQILQNIIECLNLVQDDTINNRTFVSKLKRKTINANVKKSLASQLIEALDTSSVKNNEIILNFSNGSCDLIFKMDPAVGDIYKTLKGKIYGEIHNYRYIKYVNERGKNCIKRISNLFMSNLPLFLKEYGKKTKYKSKNIYDDIGGAVYSIFRLNGVVDKKTFIKLFKEDFDKKCTIIKMSYASLSRTKSMKNFINAQSGKRIIQLFEREILHFVASLKEEEIESYFSKKYGVKKTALTRLPTKYNL